MVSKLEHEEVRIINNINKISSVNILATNIFTEQEKWYFLKYKIILIYLDNMFKLCRKIYRIVDIKFT